MINLALIGIGKWGSNYLKAVESIEGAQIKYIRKYDYDNLVKCKDLDGIIIATPDTTHNEIINKFPDKFLLVEKPVVMKWDEAKKLENEKIMAGHIYLYNKELLNLLDGGRDIQEIEFSILNDQRKNDTELLWYLAPHPVSLYVYLYGMPRVIKVKEIDGVIFVRFIYDNVIIYTKY